LSSTLVEKFETRVFHRRDDERKIIKEAWLIFIPPLDSEYECGDSIIPYSYEAETLIKNYFKILRDVGMHQNDY